MPRIPINKNIIYLTASFTHHFSRLLTQKLQESGVGITAEQLSIMVLLWQQGEVPQSQLVQSLERDKTTVARVLSNLVKMGYVRQRTDKTDLRMKVILSTAKGEATQGKALSVAGKLYLSVLKGIPMAHLGLVVRILANMNNNLKEQYEL
jgi:MarR family transcriptional regulator, organic hydroperoxide resistance regulator